MIAPSIDPALKIFFSFMHFFPVFELFSKSPPQLNLHPGGWSTMQWAIFKFFIIIVSRKSHKIASRFESVSSFLSFNGIVILGVPFNVAKVNTVNNIYATYTCGL